LARAGSRKRWWQAARLQEQLVETQDQLEKLKVTAGARALKKAGMA